MTLLETTTFNLIAAINAADGCESDCIITLKRMERVRAAGREAYKETVYYVVSQSRINDNVVCRAYYVTNDGIIETRYYDGQPDTKYLLSISDAITHGRMIVK